MATPREQRRLVHLNGQVYASGAWHSVTICNVSARGVMGKCAAPPAKGERVELRHHGFSLSGQVAWCNGERFGIACQAPIDLAALQDGTPEVRVGRRSLPRTTVRVPGELVLRDNVFTVLLVDISQSGARVYMPIPPRPGVRAVLSWSEQDRPCTVLWAKGDAFGVEFEELVPDEAVRNLRPDRLRRSERGVASPIRAKTEIPLHLQAAIPPARRENRDRRPAKRSDPLTRRVRG